jgi:stage V sporulation protein SpoVS
VISPFSLLSACFRGKCRLILGFLRLVDGIQLKGFVSALAVLNQIAAITILAVAVIRGFLSSNCMNMSTTPMMISALELIRKTNACAVPGNLCPAATIQHSEPIATQAIDTEFLSTQALDMF